MSRVRCRAHRRGCKVIVVTGSDPNIHEEVTTLVAELMREWIVNEVQPLDSERMLFALG